MDPVSRAIPTRKINRRLSLLLAAALLLTAAVPAASAEALLPPPTSLRAEQITETAANLVWDASSGAEYIVYQIYLDGKPWGETEDLTLSLYELTPGTEYTATVAAAEDYGKPFPGASTSVSFRTLGGVQADPEILSAEDVALGSRPLGTGFEDLGLPGHVNAALADGNMKRLAVRWLEDGYDGNTPGDYTLSGELVLDGCINSASIKAQATVTILPGALIPDPPGNLQVTDITHSSARLTWSAPSGAEADTVYSILLDGVPAGTTGDLDYILAGLTPETTYDASVAAEIGGVSSAPAELRFTTPAKPRPDPDIASVEALQLGGKPLGTPFSALGLPQTVPVVLEGGGTASLGVDWSESGYDGANTGTYTVFGVLRLAGCQNPRGLRAQAIVSILPDKVCTAEAVPAEISAEAGVPFAELTLPSQVRAILEGGAAIDCPVIWNGTGYRPTATGPQTIPGVLAMPGPNVENPGGVAAEITVNVADTIAPTVPANLRAEHITASSADLVWDGSSDAVGVTVYEVFLNGMPYGTTPAPVFPFSGLTAGTEYAVTVTAADAARNTSAQSSVLRFTTLSTPVTGPEILSAGVTPASVTVPQGTAFENLALPENAQALLSTGSTVDCGVSWSAGDYNADVPGGYTLSGELIPPIGVSNSAHISVTLAILVEARPDVPAPASPSPVTYPVTAATGAGGSITPKSAVVARGGNKRFIILPDTGYQIAAVLVNGAEAPAGSLIGPDSAGAYTLLLKNVREQTDIIVTFQKKLSGAVQFSDLEHHWAEDAISFAVGQGLIDGLGDSVFAPEEAATRTMAVKALRRLTGSDGVPINSGNSEEPVSRTELAVMLWQYAEMRGWDISVNGGSLTSFTDGETVPGEAEAAMEWCVERGLMRGRPGGLLAPGGTAARSELAVLLQRLAALEAKR